MTLTVKEAMELRKNRHEIESRLSLERLQYDKADRNGKRYLKQHVIKPLEKALEDVRELLKGAPVEPIDPETAWAMWSERLVEIAGEYEVQLAGARAYLGKEEVWAEGFLNRHADELVAAQYRSNHAKSILTVLTERPVVSEDLVARIQKGEEVLKAFVEQSKQEVFNKAKWGIGRSTSSISNFIEATQTSALANMVEELEGFYNYKREAALEGLNSWLTLQKEVAAEEGTVPVCGY